MITPFNPVLKNGIIYSDQWELVARERVIREAREWIGTKFHHAGRVKGANRGGVDCAMLLAEVYERAGQIPHVTPSHYPHDWHLHRDEEKYLAFILQFSVEISAPAIPKIGDVAMFRIGRTWSHGGIVTVWPTIVHAWFESCVEEADSSISPQLMRAPVKFFTLKRWIA